MSFRSLVAAGILGVLCSGASHAAAPDWYPANAKKPLSSLTVGFSSAGAAINDYVASYHQAITAYAKELGVKLVIADAQIDPAKQADQVENLVAQNVDVVMIWPVNGKAIVSVVKKAASTGVPVIIANAQMDPSGDAYVKTFAGPDDYGEGKIAGELMVKALGGKGNVVMIDGLPGYTVTRQRHDGFLEGIKGSEIKVLDSQPANFSQEKAQAVMEDYIARFGDKIDGAWSVEGNSGAGALTAVRAAVTEGKIKAGHIKLTDPTCFAADYDGIVRGDYYGSVWQSPVEDARAALKAAILAAIGEKLPSKMYFNTPPISVDNVSQFQRPAF